MAQTYKPGDTVPRDGTVKCTEYNGTQDKVKAGTKFAPCDHWGDHHGKKCTWQYILRAMMGRPEEPGLPINLALLVHRPPHVPRQRWS